MKNKDEITQYFLDESNTVSKFNNYMGIINYLAKEIIKTSNPKTHIKIIGLFNLAVHGYIVHNEKEFSKVKNTISEYLN